TEVGNYFMRLAALDSGGAQISELSSIGTIEVRQKTSLSAPTPKLPLEGVSIVPMSDRIAPVVFKWEPSEGAADYLLEVASDKDFKQILASQRVSDPQYIFNGLLPQGNIYWRLRSENGT